jgi:hypothetical protein
VTITVTLSRPRPVTAIDRSFVGRWGPGFHPEVSGRTVTKPLTSVTDRTR